MTSSGWKGKLCFSDTLLEREQSKEEEMVLPAKDLHKPLQSQWQPSLQVPWDKQALRMTSGKYRVFSVPPQMSWQETVFSRSKGKPARKCVSIDNSRSQFPSGSQQIEQGLQGCREASAYSCWKGRHTDHLVTLITEITGLEGRWGSTGKVRPWCGTEHLELELRSPWFLFLALPFMNSVTPGMSFNLSDPLLCHLWT